MATPDCEKILNLLPLYIDDMLSFEEAKKVKKHLQMCEECKSEAEYLKTIMKRTKDVKEIEIPKDFHRNLMEKVKATEIKKKKHRIILRHAGTFAVAAAVVAFCVIVPGEFKNNENIDTKNQHATARMMPDDVSNQGQNEDIPKIPVSRSVEEEISVSTVVTVTLADDIKEAALEILSEFEKDETGYKVKDIESVTKKLKELGASVEIDTNSASVHDYIIIK